MSGGKNSLLSQVHDKELTFNANVLVSRMWHYRGGTDEGPIKHTVLVVLDQEGTHVYAQLAPEPAERLKDVLEEGKVYLMKRFMCNQSKQTYRAVESPYMMQLTRFSTVVPQLGDEEDYPYCTYNLTSFSDIPMPATKTPRFFDVIGRITAVTGIVAVHSHYQAQPSDTRTIVLQDQFLFFGVLERANLMRRWFRIASEIEAVIAIFVGTLPKTYQATKGLSGSSACHWYIDEDLPEINYFRASLAQGLPPVTAHIPGEQPKVTSPVRGPPVELGVRELLDLDPFDNPKKQFMCTVVITRLGSDHRWWFLSCQKCHKTAYVSGSQYRCSDNTCPSIKADASYCICTYGSDGEAEAEFMFFDRPARSVVGKPFINLLKQKYPGCIEVHEIAQIAQVGGADVATPVEITRMVTLKYRLVVSISNKSFQPTSTQLSFQVNRIDHAFKTDLAPLGFGPATHGSGASSSAGDMGEELPVLPAFAIMPATTPAMLPFDEINTPISAFKGKVQAHMPKTPSKSPCPKNARRKLFGAPSNDKQPELAGPVPKLAAEAQQTAPSADVENPASKQDETKQVTGEVPDATVDDPKNISLRPG